VTCSGNVFQMRAPANGKARQPMMVSRAAGTIRSSEVEDRLFVQLFVREVHVEVRRRVA